MLPTSSCSVLHFRYWSITAQTSFWSEQFVSCKICYAWWIDHVEFPGRWYEILFLPFQIQVTVWPLIKDMTESCSCFPPGYCRIGSLVLDHSQRLPLCYLLLHLWLRHCSCVLLSMQCSSPHVFFLLFHDYFFFYFQTLNECGERPSPPESTSDREVSQHLSFC